MGVRLLVGTAKGGFWVASDNRREWEEWEQVADGPAYPDGDDRGLRQIWTLRENRGTLYAGVHVQDAGMFTSGDGGRSWRPVPGLNEHETRAGWMPGAGGLCCHAFLFDHNDPNRMWCGISAVGVFRTDDGGATWVPKNRGVYWAHEDEEFKEIGHCVHGLAQDPDVPERIYRQDHSGMYRSDDGGEAWKRTRWLEGWDAPVSEGDTVVFMQAVSGG